MYICNNHSISILYAFYVLFLMQTNKWLGDMWIKLCYLAAKVTSIMEIHGLNNIAFTKSTLHKAFLKFHYFFGYPRFWWRAFPSNLYDFKNTYEAMLSKIIQYSAVQIIVDSTETFYFSISASSIKFLCLI